ncbi:MAG: acireductone synthase, partial [Pseudomonadota bacterium]
MIKAIVTDIEGTTSSLSFVKDVLFPYARERMADFVRGHAKDAAVRRWLDEVRQIAGSALSNDEIITQLIRWIDEDRKITPLKALQGMIWEDGYKKGDFKGHIYEDAVRHLRKWKDAGIRLYVYSSG